MDNPRIVTVVIYHRHKPVDILYKTKICLLFSEEKKLGLSS
jgi:hypothetical protein